MNGFLRSYRIKGNDKEDYKTFLDNNKNIVNTFIKIQNKPIKNKFIQECEFYKKNKALLFTLIDIFIAK